MDSPIEVFVDIWGASPPLQPPLRPHSH